MRLWLLVSSPAIDPGVSLSSRKSLCLGGITKNMAEQVHDIYGKAVLRLAAGDSFTDWGTSVQVDYGTRIPARIDGTVDQIAVEVESRNPKQIRGAVLDLLFHSYPKKLLVILPVTKNIYNVENTAKQCRYALQRFVKPENFRVVVALGHGHNPKLEQDAELVRSALAELGFQGSA
jgi:hypothetical protein